jgi:SOS-response transcriptional repressor LexA
MDETFGATLRRLRVDCGFSQIAVAKMLTDLGAPISNKMISHWEKGSFKPEVLQFLRLCRIYGVRDPYAVFLDNRQELNALGLQRLNEYDALLRRDPRFVTPEEKPYLRRTTLIRLYDIPVSAGTGVFLDASEYTEIEVDDSVPAEADFALRISGDSMEPTLEDGQIVYVCKRETLNVGEIGIFVLNDEVYCKQLGRGELISHNDGYEPIALHDYDSFYVFGKVLN